MRVLILAQRLPYAPNRGDRLRVYHMMREIASRAAVDVAALVHDREEQDHAGDLRGIAGEVLTARVPRVANILRGSLSLVGQTPLTHVLLDSPSLAPALRLLVERRRPDVILAYCSSMARFAMEPPLDAIPCVLDMIDADSAKWLALSRTRRRTRWVYRREARLLARFEVRAMRHAFTTLVVNDKERRELLALAPDARIEVVENGVDLESFAPDRDPSPSAIVVFCGVMNYAPNVEGAQWLARSVWPLVRAERPDARLMLVGASPSPEVRALADPAAGVTVTGSVNDVRPYLWDSAVAVAPLRVARGVQNKVLEAIAAGLPCVVTREVSEGLPGEMWDACQVGETERSFADALVRLLARTPHERREMAAKTDLRPLAWSSRLGALVPLLARAASARP